MLDNLRFKGFVPPGLIIVVMFATIASFAVPRAEKPRLQAVEVSLLLLASTLGFRASYRHSRDNLPLSLARLGIPYFTLYSPDMFRDWLRK